MCQEDFWDSEESKRWMQSYNDENGEVFKKLSDPNGWNWEIEEKLISWGEAKQKLSRYQKSKHSFEGGEKNINFKLRLICCVDNNGGNFNDDTGYYFEGNNGYFFEDAFGNVFSTNSTGFYNEEKDGEQIEMPHYHIWTNVNIFKESLPKGKYETYCKHFPYQEGMIFSLTATIPKEKVHLKIGECKHTRFHTVKDGKLLNPKNYEDVGFEIGFERSKISVEDYFQQMPHLNKKETIQSSKRRERGPAGNKVKEYCNNRCQICKATGKKEGYGTFEMPTGKWYAEAHHVLQLSDDGPDTTDNIMCLCANHHRQMHYGDVKVIVDYSHFNVSISGKEHKIKRLRDGS